MKKIIDISAYQGGADLATAMQNGVDGFIFRCGLGDNIADQDDEWFGNFVDQAESLGAPWGAYLFGYALGDDGVSSEIDHALRLVEGRNPKLGVWYDLENSDYKSRNGFNDLEHPEVVDWCRRFISAMNDNGYLSGVYCDLNHARNLDFGGIEHMWVAAYFNEPDFNNPPYDCDMWQYTSDEGIEGVASRVDCNVSYAGWIEDLCNGVSNDGGDVEGKGERSMNEKIARADYVRELGRDIDASGIETYVNMLDNGSSEQEVINCLVGSDEWAQKFINDCYKAFLGREADSDGLNGWMEAYRNGEALVEICDMIYSSEEACNNRGE